MTQHLLTFASDRPIRDRYAPTSYAHPAKLHAELLLWIVRTYTQPGDVVADPMAGSGTALLATLVQRNVIAREVEPRFLAMCHGTAARIIEQAGLLAPTLGTMDIAAHDAREPWGYTADALVFSPPYGCEVNAGELASGREARRVSIVAETSPHWAYLLRRPQQDSGSWAAFTFDYGNHAAQIGHLRGKKYWAEMTTIYQQALAALRPGGVMALVIKDHILGGQRVHIADGTVTLCEQLGFRLDARHARKVWPLSFWQNLRRSRGEPIVDTEDVLVFRHASAPTAKEQPCATP